MPDRSRGTALCMLVGCAALGAGELNIGGGGMGPISETGMGGSGSSERVSGESGPPEGGGGVHSRGDPPSCTAKHTHLRKTVIA